MKPDQLAKLGITITDISNAIQAQNTVNPAGQVEENRLQKTSNSLMPCLLKDA
ncbi:hypothetical protein [Edaphobacter bradus]|uniref:hypothetical protein n=1 Tax=Edaphobacter bradus TaxID=2259016 RepID=UPI0021E0ACDA|nr:hypothetical protein [Edaphobacter bradus]